MLRTDQANLAPNPLQLLAATDLERALRLGEAEGRRLQSEALARGLRRLWRRLSHPALPPARRLGASHG